MLGYAKYRIYLFCLKVCPTYGRKMMKGYLAQRYRDNVSQKRVENALRSVAPHYHSKRQTDTVWHVNSIPYRADYFGHKLHVYQNEKLEMYGVVHVVAIDGHARYITFGAGMPRKNNKVIYTEVYRLFIFTYHTCLVSLFWRNISTFFIIVSYLMIKS